MDSMCCHTDRNTQKMSCVWNRRVTGELVYFLFLVCFTTARSSDTWTDRTAVFYSVQNCKHPGKYIGADIYKKKWKDIIFYRNSLSWSDWLLGSLLCLTATISRAWITFLENIQPHILLPRGFAVCEKTFPESPCAALFFSSFYGPFYSLSGGEWGEKHWSWAACCSINRSQNLPEMDERWFGGSDTPRRLAAARHDALCLRLAANLRQTSRDHSRD